MIELECIESPDKDVLGKKMIYFDQITIGRSRTNVVIVEDHDMEARDVRLSVVESGVFVENRESEHYFSNDKKISGKKLHSQGDRFRVGATTFKIMSFKQTNTGEEDYDSIYQRQIQQVPHKEQLFHAIKQEMDELENL